MQLVAYGAQDIYLTGNPQITFFKVVYRRHTNFSMESIEQTFNGNVGAGARVTATISRNGDLVGRLYVEANLLAQGLAGNANPGTALISEVECEIGGQRIDKHYGHWMETWAQLTELNSGSINPLLTAGMAGNFTPYMKTACSGGVDGAALAPGTVHVPLQFWFCRNPGLALPLIALQYHEVKIILTFGSAAAVGGTFPTDQPRLWADYIYLDTDERRRFAQVSHEYLIEQLQFSNFSNTLSMDLNFNHPVT